MSLSPYVYINYMSEYWKNYADVLFPRPLSAMFLQLTKEQEWYQKSEDKYFPNFHKWKRRKADSRKQESKQAHHEQNKPTGFTASEKASVVSNFFHIPFQSLFLCI